MSHEPGFSVDGVFRGNSDLKSSNRLLKKYDKRILVKETDDGKNMSKYSNLLEESISSIINVKEKNDFNSFFKEGETSYMKNVVSGLNDFELICFLVIQ